MKSITLTRTIIAPIEDVFRTVADIRQFSQAISYITNVEFLSEQKTGVGTRFRETRLMRGREALAVLEVTEHAENDRIRLVCDMHGTVWDTVFTVRDMGGQVELLMVMEARARKWVSGLMTTLSGALILKAVESDMDTVKVSCKR